MKSKRQQKIEAARRKKDPVKTTFFILSISFALLFVTLLILPTLNKATAEGTRVSVKDVILPAIENFPQANGNALGDPDAPVVVEEYSDFRCPHCLTFVNQQENQFIKDYVETGKVYLKIIPYSFISPESYSAAEAMYCANDQNKLWEYRAVLWANYDASFTTQRLIAFAEALEMDKSAFEKCYTAKTYQQKVLDDFNAGSQKGINSTPSFWINGEIVNSAELPQKVDALLAGK